MPRIVGAWIHVDHCAKCTVDSVTALFANNSANSISEDVMSPYECRS